MTSDRSHRLIIACDTILSMVFAPVIVVATIAAHDPLGGAGLAADLTTFAALGVHGVVAVTATTAQHLDSVDHVHPADSSLVAAQLDGITETFSIAALKTGLLGSAQTVQTVVERLDDGRLPAPVVDPVLVDGRGERFVSTDVERAYRELLIPRAAVVTPNLREASLLVGHPLQTVADVVRFAPELGALGAPLVVVTGGGFRENQAVDVLVTADGAVSTLQSRWVNTLHVRGSGCTFAAAIAAFLGRGVAPNVAVEQAKEFVVARLKASRWPGLAGTGPISHCHDG